MASSVFGSNNSRYSYGGITEESKKFVEWWERVNIPKDVTDNWYVMERKYVGRPDLVATVMYNDASLAWFILQYNNILDPIEELVEGVILRIPTMERIQRLLTTNRIDPVDSSRSV